MNKQESILESYFNLNYIVTALILVSITFSCTLGKFMLQSAFNSAGLQQCLSIPLNPEHV